MGSYQVLSRRHVISIIFLPLSNCSALSNSKFGFRQCICTHALSHKVMTATAPFWADMRIHSFPFFVVKKLLRNFCVTHYTRSIFLPALQLLGQAYFLAIFSSGPTSSKLSKPLPSVVNSSPMTPPVYIFCDIKLTKNVLLTN